jgi:hypothetical protein
MANIGARSMCKATFDQQMEFELEKGELLRFIDELRKEVTSGTTEKFHLQIARKGVAPSPGASAPINKGDLVTVTVHRF